MIVHIFVCVILLRMSHPVRRVRKSVEHHTFPPAFRPSKQNHVVLMRLSWITVATTLTQTHLGMFMQCKTHLQRIFVKAPQRARPCSLHNKIFVDRGFPYPL